MDKADKYVLTTARSWQYNGGNILIKKLEKVKEDKIKLELSYKVKGKEQIKDPIYYIVNPPLKAIVNEFEDVVDSSSNTHQRKKRIEDHNLALRQVIEDLCPQQ